MFASLITIVPLLRKSVPIENSPATSSRRPLSSATVPVLSLPKKWSFDRSSARAVSGRLQSGALASHGVKREQVVRRVVSQQADRPGKPRQGVPPH